MRIYFKGKMSIFGGPSDRVVAVNEGLALVNDRNLAQYREYFLPNQPPGTTGLARRLNPEKFYIACRWDYKRTPPALLSNIKVRVINLANGRSAEAIPIDWGPNEATGRVADLSPGLARHLGLKTNDVVEVKYGMMFLKGPEFTRLPKAQTKQENAWDGEYETYRINVTLHGIRLHPKFHRRFGCWFAVDRYNDNVSEYRKAMALINPAEVAESYILPSGAVFNVGIVKEQGALPGGGWQFEYVSGRQPLHDEHMPNLRSDSKIPL